MRQPSPTRVTRKAVADIARGSLRADKRIAELGLGKIRASLIEQVQAAEGLAEERAATKLNEARSVLSLVYARLWKCSLSAERDRLLAITVAADASPATIAAKRGRITRDLVAEVETYINERAARDGKR